MRVFAAALGFCALTGGASACDIAFPDGVEFQTREKAPGWTVRILKPESGAEGFLLFTMMRRRAIPAPKEERAFLEGAIGKAASSLYGRKPEKVSLMAPSTPDRQRAAMRGFTVTLTFGGETYAARGFMFPNARRKDSAMVVAFPAPGDEDRGMILARQTALHPGFDCTDGDSP